ncbi:uncharacterized protein LOC6546480 [Drosophila erecta]|uniref:Uncharacterized protein n=1 Tax=Drosophila erecta TaxID=7220 RepID=B3NBF3_DROER|nr:uncharacterized protein LOC6546480 [Drosophila erecta]EDV50275.1 uncharacterized protein Dere_GG14528 [Drosophila erecta]
MSFHRINPRQASVAARQRQSRSTRMTRHTIFNLKRPITFQVRKSLVEYVDMELADMDTSVFYQRIFILAKNCHLTPVASAEELPVDVVVEQAEPEPAEAEPTQFMENVLLDDTESHMATMADPAPIPAPDEPVTETGEVVTHLFRFSEGDIEEQFVEEEELEIDTQAPDQPKDFFAVFSARLQELHKQCLALAITPDPMCGLYLHMGEYSMLMLESSEDMIGCFTRALADCCENFWLMNRVFQIEDHVQELYTKELMYRRIPSVFLNEKFPTSTPTDEYLMGKQHLIIKDKLLTICRLLSDGQQVDVDASSTRGSDFDEDLLKSKSKSSILSDHLPVEVFRKHLPEIQRIELVLASTRFYYELREFTGLYGRVPFAPDEDGLFWPIQSNYTPPNIFRRTPYDINLTFGEYAAEAGKRKTRGSQVGSVGGEEEAPENQETPPKTE